MGRRLLQHLDTQGQPFIHRFAYLFHVTVPLCFTQAPVQAYEWNRLTLASMVTLAARKTRSV